MISKLICSFIVITWRFQSSCYWGSQFCEFFKIGRGKLVKFMRGSDFNVRLRFHYFLNREFINEVSMFRDNASNYLLFAISSRWNHKWFLFFFLKLLFIFVYKITCWTQIGFFWRGIRRRIVCFRSWIQITTDSFWRIFDRFVWFIAIQQAFSIINSISRFAFKFLFANSPTKLLNFSLNFLTKRCWCYVRITYQIWSIFRFRWFSTNGANLSLDGKFLRRSLINRFLFSIFQKNC